VVVMIAKLRINLGARKNSGADGFTASELAARVRALSKQSPCQYGPRHAAYDLKKLRGKQIVRRIGHTRRYEAAIVAEIADQFLLFGVDRDHWLLFSQRSGHLGVDIGELLRMAATSFANWSGRPSTSAANPSAEALSGCPIG
jgi:hypothetical protein